MDIGGTVPSTSPFVICSESTVDEADAWSLLIVSGFCPFR